MRSCSCIGRPPRVESESMAEPGGNNPGARACAHPSLSANTGMPPTSTECLHAGLEPARSRLLARDEAILTTQVAVTEIPAPTGNEAQRGRWIAQRFARLGLSEVHSDDAGNVIGWRGVRGERAPVVVCAH